MAIINSLSFLKQYVTKPRTVGAVLPSSKYLTDKMTRNIAFESAICIVEYGAGTGVFTEQILRKKKPDTLLLVFENNPEFYTLLCEKFKNQRNTHIVNDSAAYVGKYLMQHNLDYADYIVSGLPFASLPQEVSQNILSQTKKHLKSGGSFITFQYTLIRKSFIAQYFNDITIKKELRNVPPAYVLYCKQ